MPTSNLYVWPEVVALVDQVPHTSVLDVGPGHGKASILLREYMNVPPHRIVAVEAEETYVDRFSLTTLYDEVLIGDVCGMTAEALGDFDVALMVDVIEHITDEAAFDLLRRIPGRVVVCTPVEWFQTDDGLPPSEAHVSHWTNLSWTYVATFRPIEVCYQSCGGWLVRLGPLPSPG